MYTSLKLQNFKGIPHLADTLLMQQFPKGLRFSTKKTNVLVGPNGAGKSSVLKALALHSLSYTLGYSNLDSYYVLDSEAAQYWTKEKEWSREEAYLEGLQVSTDFAPAVYYQPGQIPGNEYSITHAMMTGYFDEAKAYALLVKDKSAGQRNHAVLQRAIRVLEGTETLSQYAMVNWRGPRKADVNRTWQVTQPWERRAEVLLQRLDALTPEAVPVVLLDEPEQSLDAKSEVQLWNLLAQPRDSVQCIVATHSLCPLLMPNKFNIIEAVPGYLDAVMGAMKLSS